MVNSYDPSSTTADRPDEILLYARAPQDNPYKAEFGSLEVIDHDGKGRVEWEGEVICGHNPWIEARLVGNVRPLPGDPEGGITWDELPRPAPLDLTRQLTRPYLNEKRLPQEPPKANLPPPQRGLRQ